MFIRDLEKEIKKLEDFHQGLLAIINKDSELLKKISSEKKQEIENLKKPDLLKGKIEDQNLAVAKKYLQELHNQNHDMITLISSKKFILEKSTIRLSNQGYKDEVDKLDKAKSKRDEKEFKKIDAMLDRYADQGADTTENIEFLGDYRLTPAISAITSIGNNLSWLSFVIWGALLPYFFCKLIYSAAVSDDPPLTKTRNVVMSAIGLAFSIVALIFAAGVIAVSIPILTAIGVGKTFLDKGGELIESLFNRFKNDSSISEKNLKQTATQAGESPEKLYEYTRLLNKKIAYNEQIAQSSHAVAQAVVAGVGAALLFFPPTFFVGLTLLAGVAAYGILFPLSVYIVNRVSEGFTGKPLLDPFARKTKEEVRKDLEKKGVTISYALTINEKEKSAPEEIIEIKETLHTEPKKPDVSHSSEEIVLKKLSNGDVGKAKKAANQLKNIFGKIKNKFSSTKKTHTKESEEIDTKTIQPAKPSQVSTSFFNHDTVTKIQNKKYVSALMTEEVKKEEKP